MPAFSIYSSMPPQFVVLSRKPLLHPCEGPSYARFPQFITVKTRIWRERYPGSMSSVPGLPN